MTGAPQLPPQLRATPPTRARSGGAAPPVPQPLTPHERRMLEAENELAAAWELKNANEQNIKKLFASKQLVIKPTAAAAGVAAVAQAARNLESSIPKGARAAGAAAGGAGAAQVAATLSGDAGAGLGTTTGSAVLGAFAKALPIVGVVKGAGELLLSLYSLASSAWLKYHTAEVAKSSFAPGDPAAALEALREMLGREMKETAIDAASLTVQLGLDIAAAVGTGGAGLVVSGYAKGVADNLVTLCKSVYLFRQEQAEVDKANQYLKSGPWDLSLFKYAPLLGCYLLRCSSSSAVVNMAIGDYAKPGWKIDTEGIAALKRKAEPLIDKAGELIRNARYEIPQFAYHAGIAPPVTWNPISKLKRRAYDRLHQEHKPSITR
ncbi:MAG TPA: hypothetical protein VE397_13580 [Stellaceae bacterium]|nr:hypothetical protein [Stellaceae bacterium]